MAHNVLYNKYRPLILDDIVGQEHIVTILKNSITKNKISHAYLFSGIRGTGKTTVARILAKYLNCSNPDGYNPCNECSDCLDILNDRHLDVEEIDAASNRGVDDARKLRERIVYATQKTTGHRVIIIDEAHQLTSEASQALLKTFEEPPNNTIFILCTTEPASLLDTIHSRCQCLNFKPVSTTLVAKHLSNIAEQEEWNLEDSLLHNMAVLSGGSVRDGMSNLEKLSSVIDDEGNVDNENAMMVLGVIDSENIHKYLTAMSMGDIAQVFEIINNIVLDGKDLSIFIRDVLVWVKDMICVKTCKDLNMVNHRTDKEKEQISVLLEQMPALSLMSTILSNLEEAYDKMVSKKNLPPDVIIVESSIRIISRVLNSKKKGE